MLNWSRYVLSTTHLHEFKSPDRIASQSPVMSLPLADQKLGSRSQSDSTSHKFMLKGRQAGGMHRGHAWVFRAESYDTMLAWYSDIKNLTEKTGAERNEFIRRSHARSVSASSNKAASVSSDGLEEDEADEVPYSATASQAEIPVAATEDKVPQRPHPGGRFPSALNVNRDSQVPASPTSSDDREAIAAAGALPGSGVGHTGDGGLPGELAGASIAPNQYSPFATQQDYQSLPVHHGAISANLRQPYAPERHDSIYGEWMAPVTAGAGGGALGAASIGTHHNNKEQNDASIQDEQPGLQAVETMQSSSVTTALTSSIQASPSNALTSKDESSAIAPTATDVLTTSHIADPAAPFDDLANRPPLQSHTSAMTISELHVPGEFPEGKGSPNPL